MSSFISHNLEDIPLSEIKNYTFLVRVNFDDTHFDLDQEIDDIRMHLAKPTIDHLSENKGKVILFNHIGRPNGEFQHHLQTNQIIKAFSKLIGKPITKIEGEIKTDGSFSLIGVEAQSQIKKMKPGDIVMLDNTRFDTREKHEDEAQRLSMANDILSLVSKDKAIFVIDGFPITHRDNTASVTEISKLIPGVKGFWQIKEEMLHHDFLKLLKLRTKEDRLTAIFGGNKPDKQHEVTQFSLSHLQKNDYLILAGKYPDVLLDEQTEKELIKRGVHIQKPLDFAPGKRDIGPKTISRIKEILVETDILFWEGPLGKFEEAPFHEGGFAIARHVAELTEKSEGKIRRAFLSGGELGWMTKMALDWSNEHLGSIEGFTISSGGGTSIAFLSGDGKMVGTKHLRGWKN